MLVSGAISIALAILIYEHFKIRFLTDPRLSPAREILETASQQYPQSPRIYYRLAEAEMIQVASHPEETPRAITYAQKAVKLSMWDYRMRRLLGALQELNGDQEDAEKSLRYAAKLAPNHAEVNWALANLLLRRGKLRESLESFRIATATNEDLLSLAFELLWQSSGKDRSTLKEMIGSNGAAQLSLAQFLLDQSLPEEALDIFRDMERETKLGSTKSAAIIRSLITAGQMESARALWLDLVISANNRTANQTANQTANPAVDSSGSSRNSTELVWNGSFELSSVAGLEHFDWTLSPSEYARFGIDNGVAHSGSRSLRIAFAGRDTTILNGEVKQLLVLKPSTHYLLECYAKGSELTTPEGPRVAIMDGGEVIAQSLPVVPELKGSNEWQRLQLDFVAPATTSPKFVTIVRRPKYAYDDPTRGLLWFDDFSLSQQSSDHNSNGGIAATSSH